MDNYSVEADGVYLHYLDAQEQERVKRLCSPLKVTACSCDPDSGNWGKILQWIDKHGVKHRWMMYESMLAAGNREVTCFLLAGGLKIELYQGDDVIEYIQSIEPKRSVTTITQTGWHGDGYILPDLIIQPPGEAGATGPELYYAPPNSNLKTLYAVRGTSDDWRCEVAELCRRNSRLLFSVSAAFSGPTLTMLREEGGGFHLHSLSSVGKTTCLIAAGSVYGGGGPNGFLDKWLATANGLELTAAAHNDCLLGLDELGELDAREAVKVAYLLAGGQSKMRMNSDGGGQKQKTWRLQFLSSGELTLDQLAQSVGQKTRGGMEVRLASIPADAGAGIGAFEHLHGSVNGNHFSDRVLEAGKTYYGAIGIDWLTCLVHHRDDCTRHLRTLIEEFMANHTPAGAIGEVARVVRRFAVVAAAGELATMLDLTGWDEGEAEAAAAKCLQAWLDQRGGGSNSHDGEQMLAQVRLFLQSHRARFREIPEKPMEGASYTGPIQHQAGFYRIKAQETTFYFSTEVFRVEVCRGYDHRLVLAALHKGGHLIKDGGRWDKQIGKRRERFYAVKDSLLSQLTNEEMLGE